MKRLTRLTLVGAVVLGALTLLLATLSGLAAPTTPAPPLASPSATYCPIPTPEPFWVEPVTSPTRLFSQTVRVYLGNCELVTVTAESGTFTTRDGCYPQPATVDLALLPDTVHHLEVSGKVREVEWNGCVYGGYTMHTTRDKNGAPLVITQQFTIAFRGFLPLIWKE